ncbi:hypothetical protein G6F46_001262 [Rhizopus delemar]|uniref:Peregrin n=2 Tax=Rhizopus TaxID=4842 RepID=A0A9P6YWS7_9FUNG|nr:hypothetical protein G6F55_008573 [Rhizopus delemar]KAG1538597.1 hypothetical protein G6F51_009674 [Rhizopus arrhizus]KAG1521939.1 hypothetical protein G6F52_006293 [Rhizopus delemar]KAG1546890.1 hypothetical protein G6F49_010365 [Rhizopus delemar]KAG1566104.1 hypothetical protein G6F50_009451 [Rhizopus delemar]
MSSEIILSTQKTSGRRGRPRKHPLDTDKLLKQQERKLLRLQQQLEEQKRKLQQKEIYSLENKPREECSYKDFYPDLNIREPLSIVIKSPPTSIAEARKSKEVDPLKSPTSDEYETASEGEEAVEIANPIINQQRKLPVPSFQVDTTHNSGNNELPIFKRPENHYIRYTEPSESQLFNTIEYDMDEQDEIWLKILNNERRKEKLGELNADLFENIIDQLEKEWFDLVKNLPKRVSEELTFPEDSKCAICDDGECENSNAIVFCDGCNLAVHQDCYGVPYIPEGQWLCRKCMVSPDKPVSCIFCPTEGGAFKQTTTNQWGHLLCAIWIPEVSLGNSVYMEPIDNIANIPKSRWKLTCYICRRRQGACIQCDNKHCFTAFHVTCARWARLYMKMKPPNSHYDDVALKAFCDKHTPKDYKEQIDVDKSIAAAQQWFLNQRHKKRQQMPRRRYVDEELEADSSDNPIEDNVQKKKPKRKRKNSITQLLSTSKAARAHQHHYSAGAPVAPQYIMHKLENMKCVREANLRKKSSLIKSVCRYWSLKRESKRGAPLLKRLHLEPWTASASQLKESEVEAAQKASSLMNLRSDLEKVRILTEQVQKREKQKLDRARKQKAYLELILFPLDYIIGPVLDQISDLDKNGIFRYPVTQEIAPDYQTIVKEPISFSEISDKIESHAYTGFDQFENDVSLIWKNCMTYNRSDTSYYKLAQRLKRVSVGLIAKAREAYEALDTDRQTGFLNVQIDSKIFAFGDDESHSYVCVERNQNLDDLAKENKPNTIENEKDQQLEEEKEDDEQSAPDNEPLTPPPLKPTVHTKTKLPIKRKATTKSTDGPPKKRKAFINLVQDLPDKFKISNTPRFSMERRLTRSKTEESKRSLRSRSMPRVTLEKKGKNLNTLRRKPVVETKRTKNQRSSGIGLNEQNKSDILMDKKKSQTISFKLQYRDKEIVWARVPGYPSHPAEIVEEKKHKNIPDNVLGMDKQARH